MATSTVVPTAPQNPADAPIPNEYVGKVTKKSNSPFTGKEITVTGNFKVPLATDQNKLMELTQSEVKEVLFWFNLARKNAARAQVTAALDFDFTDENLSKLNSSFNAVMKQMVDKNSSEEKRKRVINFILSEDKFAPLRDQYKSWESEGIKDENFDFSVLELKKPSGIKGRQKKVVDGAEGEVEVEDSEENGEETEE